MGFAGNFLPERLRQRLHECAAIIVETADFIVNNGFINEFTLINVHFQD
jgi:hypothetical protein